MREGRNAGPLFLGGCERPAAVALDERDVFVADGCGVANLEIPACPNDNSALVCAGVFAVGYVGDAEVSGGKAKELFLTFETRSGESMLIGLGALILAAPGALCHSLPEHERSNSVDITDA